MYKQPYTENYDGIKLGSSRTTNSAVQTGPLLHWVNLMKDCCPSTLASQIEQYSEIRVYHDSCPANLALTGTAPDFICFEYDYPDCDSLNSLKETRALYPNIPLIMFTLQHSEELAVWALRNRIWDYYYKPVDKNSLKELLREILRCYASDNFKQQAGGCHFINSPYPNEVRFNNIDQGKKIADIAVNYVNENYSRKISEKDVADICNLSRFQFSRLFKKHLGITFQTYLLELRMTKAKILLLIPGARVIDVAFSVGFTDPAYFTRAFKRHVGTPPSSFQFG